MPITKFDSYYNKLEEVLKDIENEQGYTNISLAFAHWFLKNQIGLSEQEIGESIIDGDGDYGIDAVRLDQKNKTMTVYQFKFPQKQSIGKEISQGDILKTLNGFSILMGQNEVQNNSNKEFIMLRDTLKQTEIYSFNIVFVSYNKGILSNQDTVDNFLEKYNSDFETTSKVYDRNDILNIFERLQRRNSITVKIPIKTVQQAYQLEDENIESWVAVINGKKLIKAIKSKLSAIFDENIRLFENKSKINNNIYKSATNIELANMFYFYNNGITFIGDSVKYSPTNLTVTISGASIVNGCQTVTVLSKAFDENKLDDNVHLLVRFIKISDYDQRAKITQFLNSQTPIKESYFIANHTIIRDLQHKLLDKGYFLERQINEYEYKCKYDNNSQLDKNLPVIHLDDAIQYFTGYYIDKVAPAAKSSKSELFTDNRIEEILGNITASKVIKAQKEYSEVSEIITLYRRLRRDSTKKDFLNFLGLNEENFKVEQFLFVNTADILILNTIAHLEKNKNMKNFTSKERIRKAILLIKEIKEKNPEYKSMLPANFTRNKAVYDAVRKAAAQETAS